MTDIAQTTAQLIEAFPDNTAGLISAQDGRNLIVSAMGYVSDAAPSVDNDSEDSAGIGNYFDSGSTWIDTSTGTIYFCSYGTAGAAVWQPLCACVSISPGNQTGDVTFLAGTGGSSWSVAAGDQTITYNLPTASSSQAGIVSTTTQSFAGAKTIISDSTTTTPLTLQGTASQSAPLLSVVNSDDTVITAARNKIKEVRLGRRIAPTDVENN